MYLSSSILALSLLSGSIATSIGPVANLPVVNKVIAPDGFTRKTVLAGGTYPGPLIKGYMVR
jgi:iron transport multicopper oxidase